jgi:hypothetical protein
MIQLIYMSTASRRISTDDLQTILFTSIDHNSQNGITGLLIYDQGTFCQVLEGSKSSVHNLYAKIIRDERHSNVIKIYDDQINTREFSSWSMKCINLDNFDKSKIDGYQNFSELASNWNCINPIVAKEMLLSLKSF